MLALYSVLVMLVMSLVLGLLIAVFSRVFEIKKDPRVSKIAAILPAYNCGSCGFSGCEQYAQAVVDGKAPDNRCTPGGATVAAKVREVMSAS